jgi:DNA-binding MarR family transcriptional regulator
MGLIYPDGIRSMKTLATTEETEADSQRALVLLENIENDPDITQASLADQLGVAIGTVNWYLKRLIEKGYVKVTRAQRRKLRYIITPEGLALRARLTVNYIETSMRLYRRIRLRVRDLLVDMRRAGYEQVRIEGDGDIADICRLTCLEQGIKVVSAEAIRHDIAPNPPQSPTLEVHGTKVFLRM